MPPLRVDPALPVPLWSQIEDGLRRRIATGALAPGAAMPSVRELAGELRVNPATVVRAYQRLVDDGMLEARRGAGTFVAAAPALPSRAERLRGLREAAHRFVDQAAGLGASRDDAEAALRAAWPRASRDSEEER
ncbi:MAG: GntR family transcriptional regulator [Vicinamibacteria bacterium]|jgi:GntR family transcriptional regulator|nr:GntR family transcriptional regulator [Vicinamibacteria bacterium]